MKRCKKLLSLGVVLLLSLGSIGSAVFADEINSAEVAETVMETEEAISLESEVETESESEIVVETETEIETEAVVETETEIETEAVVETETEVETEAVIETETETETETESETETEEDEVELMAIAQVTGLKAVSKSDGVHLSWTAVTGVTGYKIKRLGTDGKYHLIHSGKATSWTDANAACNAYSSYKVCAYKLNSKTKKITSGPDSAAKKGIKKLKAVANLAASSRFNGVRLTWTKKKAATGYKIYAVRYGQKNRLIATVKDANYVDIDAPIEGDSSYVVYPYVLVNGSKVVGDKSATVKGKKVYYYASAAPTVTKNKVTISPYSFYYDSAKNRYVAECYIINGRSAQVSQVDVIELTFSTKDGVVLCSRNFGRLSDMKIGANKTVKHTFYFPSTYVKSYKGTETLNWFSKISYLY